LDFHQFNWIPSERTDDGKVPLDFSASVQLIVMGYALRYVYGLPHPSQKLFVIFAQIRRDLFLRGGGANLDLDLPAAGLLIRFVKHNFFPTASVRHLTVDGMVLTA
jgi:hypothetical protein